MFPYPSTFVLTWEEGQQIQLLVAKILLFSATRHKSRQTIGTSLQLLSSTKVIACTFIDSLQQAK